MKKFMLFVFATSLIGLSCEHTNTSESDIDPNRTNIRIQNASDYDFLDVVIDPSGNLTSYGNIQSGQTTAYKPFDRAYHYAYVRLSILGETFIIQPIDYVGEIPLGPGKFTYVLEVIDFANRSLSITTESEQAGSQR